ncbi:hypothetical protein PRIPAC_87830 [Pristionchus pacificus]|nr:hypothetical protein PRIPAC_87830 [Pristionchus pacificus]
MRTTSSLVLLAIGLVAALADDRSFCEGECEKKYKEDNVKSACAAGCTHRGSISDGTRGFAVCHAACAAAHNGTDTEERRGCDFACSLPVTNIVMMKVDYGSGDSAPRVQVVRKEGGNLLGSNLGFGPDFDQFLLRPSDINGGALATGDDSKASKDEGVGADNYGVPAGLLHNMFKLKTDDEEFNQMQDRLDKLVKSFFDRAHMASSRAASERPKGHDDAFSSFFDKSSSWVGNEDADGRQILFVAPLEGEEIADLRDFERSHEATARHRTRALFQWSVCLVLLIAVFCTALVALLMVRQMRVNRYRALRGQAAARVTAPMPLVEAGELVKKMPIDMDEESYPAPEGVPPPAYDQLSVHSKKAQDVQQQ